MSFIDGKISLQRWITQSRPSFKCESAEEIRAMMNLWRLPSYCAIFSGNFSFGIASNGLIAERDDDDDGSCYYT